MAVVDAGISATTGGSCAALATVLYVGARIPKLARWIHRLQGPRIQLVLVMTASTAMLSTPAGRWWNSAVTGANRWASGLIGQWTGLVVVAIGGLVALLFLIGFLLEGHASHKALVLAVLVPVLAATIPGPVGEFIVTGLSAVASVVGRGVGYLFGAG